MGGGWRSLGGHRWYDSLGEQMVDRVENEPESSACCMTLSDFDRTQERGQDAGQQTARQKDSAAISEMLTSDKPAAGRVRSVVDSSGAKRLVREESEIMSLSSKEQWLKFKRSLPGAFVEVRCYVAEWRQSQSPERPVSSSSIISPPSSGEV